MGEGLALAHGGVHISAEPEQHGWATHEEGSAEVEAVRRRLLRLAFDVHDGPMQDLIGMMWRLQSARDHAIKEAEQGEFAALATLFDDFAGDLGRIEKGLRSLMFSLEHNASVQTSLRTLDTLRFCCAVPTTPSCCRFAMTGVVSRRGRARAVRSTSASAQCTSAC